MFYAYILQSELNGSFYKGMSDDPDRRLIEHNSGKEKSTKRYRPWKLVWKGGKETMAEAKRLETKIKNITSRDKILKFIKKYSEGSPDAA